MQPELKEGKEGGGFWGAWSWSQHRGVGSQTPPYVYVLGLNPIYEHYYPLKEGYFPTSGK